MKKEIRAWLFLTAWILLGLSIVQVAATAQPPAEDKWIESTEDVLRFDMEAVEAELEEITVEQIETENVEQATEADLYEGIVFYDVPLSKELQMHTFMECDGYSIASVIPLAIMGEESEFIANEVSPNGAIGIMQIAPVWHQERMDRLGCTDLYDPYQNITVGIDYLAELIDMNPDIVWVLTAYRYGPDRAEEKINNGEIDYALAVLERAHELEVEYGSNR